jgi:LuxR family maltose regulon positive regulatory protein
MAVQSIRLLGAFEVSRDGQPLTAGDWRNQQTRTILKLLLTRQGRVVPADQLLELLWPEADPDTARRSLHVRISQLRRALDPDNPDAYILTVEGGYVFNPGADCRIDAIEFEARAQWGRRCQESGNLAEAITAYETARSLYRGDLLEEDLYEDWAFAERERLRECFLTLLIEVAECYARQGHYRRAITRCREVLATDPCRESVYVHLMLYHYYAGEQDLALRVYERCCQVLSDELGVEPLPQTTALYEQIVRRQVAPVDGAVRYPEPAYEGRLFEAPYSLGRTPFVGREREYAWLVERLREATVNGGRVAVVAGEAGLGKTRLAEQALG